MAFLYILVLGQSLTTKTMITQQKKS